MSKLLVHPIAQAQINGTGVGTTVPDPRALLTYVESRLDECVGQKFLPILTTLVRSGDIERTDDLQMKAVKHRGEWILVADRSQIPVENLAPKSAAAIVYDREAFLHDPQTTQADLEWLGDASHVLVTLLASRGPKPQVSSHRFVRNLAGGNNDYMLPRLEDMRPSCRRHTDDLFRWATKLAEIVPQVVEYEQSWVVVG